MTERVLLANVFLVAICALVYELLCGTLASYLLGDTVLQFALVLGIYLFAMGAGAWWSRRLTARAEHRYLQAELLLSLVGGLSIPTLLLAVQGGLPLRPLLYTVVFVIGALVGLELPLLVAILRRGSRADGDTAPRNASFGDVVARALAFDYVGALAASLLFPLVLVPGLGVVRTSAAAGIVNALAALSATFVMRAPTPSSLALVRAASGVVLCVLGVALAHGDAWVSAATD